VPDLTVVPARSGRAIALAAGDRLRIVNVHGAQVVDTWALCPPDGAEHLSMEHTRTSLTRMVPRTGDALYSNRRRPLLVLEEDTSPGVHDTLIAACDPERYRQLGHDGPHASCAENFATAVAAAGLPPLPVPAPLNLFMSIPWTAGGELRFEPAPARPGDRVTLAALDAVVVVVSACPMDLNAINQGEPVGVELERLPA
jgi:uncharacterized protein YcgI (DUF1989 family)